MSEIPDNNTQEMSDEVTDYRKLAEALADALEKRNLWIEGEEYRELVILRMRLCNKVDSLSEELKVATARIAELEAENNRLAELLHNELSSVEIATDLGNKRWVALNDIYENGEKHNANWCKRKAQEGLGIK